MGASRVFTTPNDMGRDMRRYTDRPDQWGEHWFGRALPRTRNGGATDIAAVHWWGDSLTVGDDASSEFGQAAAGANTTAQKDAWRADSAVGVFRAGMQARYGDSGEGWQPFGLAVTTGTWTNRLGAGVAEARASAAATATFKVRGTSMVLFYRAGQIAGSFRWQVDGGAFTTVTTNGAAAFDPGSSTIGGLSDGEHTARVEWVSGTIAINGVRGMRAAAGVRVDRFAQHGAAGAEIGQGAVARRQMTIVTVSGNPSITAGTGGYFTAADVGSRITGQGTGALGAFIGSVTNATTASLVDPDGVATNASASGTGTAVIEALKQPELQAASGVVGRTFGSAFAPGVGPADLVVYAFGVNDAAGGNRVNPDSVADAASRLLSYYTPADDTTVHVPDVVFVIHHIGKWFNVEQRYPSYAGVLREVAAGVGGAVIDCWAAGRRSYQHARAQRYWSGASAENQVHVSKLGHRWLGEAMLDLALQ